MPSWKRLEKLNGGDQITYTDPLLDTPKEVWFYSADYELRIWHDGALERHVPASLPLAGAVQQRVTLYHQLRELFVDVEQRADCLLVRRGVLNGKWIAMQQPTGELDALRARYRALGFQEVTPWNASKNHVTRREYRKDGGTLAVKAWTVEVDGMAVIEKRVETPAKDRQAAVSLAEERIAAQEESGFTLHLIELMKAKHPNPMPKRNGAAPASSKALSTLAKPSNPFEAVDAAVALLKDLHVRLPQIMFIGECLRDEEKEARVNDLGEDASFFLEMHQQRVGRWIDLPSQEPREAESSWDYFARVYDSITWIVRGQADDGMAMFYCGNVSGGGWSCLEIDSDGAYDMYELMDATGNDELELLFVFHGGWHSNRSWAFDQRTVSTTGEHAIVPFDEGMAELPRRTPVGKIVPFGTWLYKRVVTMAKIMARNAHDLNL